MGADYTPTLPVLMADRLAQKRKLAGQPKPHDYGRSVQSDWEDRAGVESIQLNIMAIASFLNDFEKSTRYKLACVSEKMAKVSGTTKMAMPRQAYVR